jgi:preflagellin peptidase FlaK
MGIHDSECMDWLSVTRVAIALALLTMAAISDWETRTASDRFWAIMGAAGLALLGAQIIIDDLDPIFLLILLPIGWVFFDMLWDRKGLFEDGINWLPLMLYVVSAVYLTILVALYYESEDLWALMSILIMFAVYYLMYILDIIKGGADAKALIALTLLIPVYPTVGMFPIVPVPEGVAQFVMPFSLLVLFYGALLTLGIPIYYLFYNLAKGDRRFPAMLFGRRMDLEEAKKKHVWPMEHVEGQEVEVSSVPQSNPVEEQFAALEARGMKRIWVTPKIPMLIPITMGLIIAVVVGNIVFALM